MKRCRKQWNVLERNKNGEIKSGEVIAEKLANLGFVQQKAYNLILFSKGSHNISNYLIDRF